MNTCADNDGSDSFDRAGLESAILHWVAAAVAGTRSPRCVVFLCVAYDPADELFPAPVIGLGTSRERSELARSPLTRARLARMGDLARTSFYNPANYSHFDLPELQCDREDIERLGARNPARHPDWADFYLSVGRRLGQVDWSAYLDISPDFVSFTTDIQLDDLETNLRSLLPFEARREMVDNGWLPVCFAQ